MSVFGLDPRVERHLIADEGEVIVDEVGKHWAAKVGCVLEMVAAAPVLLLLAVLPKPLYFVPLLLALGLLLHGLWRYVGLRMDRFVITNMRVFRVHGILSQRIATMPLSRILDISVHTPFVGRLIGYGHFVFESAAQDQGLREIRFVGRPDERGLTIQRVIQRSGLRGRMHQPDFPTPEYDPSRVGLLAAYDAASGGQMAARAEADAAADTRDLNATRDYSDELPWWRETR
ncbi:PH domain-containing protein [Agromyces sp. NPDC060279]|uniref:PH domain-containing protein n=1 Tax=Agromyces sp. NPDC060279 TaxID=3347092 RepID=UPI003657F88A